MKAKLRRLCEDKAKCGEKPKLQVPQWLHDEWKSRDHLEMALEFRDCGFDKDLYCDFILSPKKNYMDKVVLDFNQFISVFFLFQATVASMFVAILGRTNSSSSGNVLSRKRNPQRTRSKLVGIPKKTWQRSCIGMRIFFRQKERNTICIYRRGCL